jgi:SHS2 domain-containing protein
MGTKQFEVIAHTADIAVEVRGSDLADLLVNAAHALYSVELSDTPSGGEIERLVSLESVDDDALVVDWLNELIYLLDAEHLVFVDFVVRRLSGGRADIQCRGQRLDATRLRRLREVKAATYHMARLRRTSTGYACRIVFDI